MPAPILAEWRRKREAWLLAEGLQKTDSLESLGETARHEYHRQFTTKFHELLDAGSGECHLANPACAGILTTRLIAGHGKAYRLGTWCIMPNHLHALVEPLEPNTLGEIIRHWKGGSARDMNKLLGRQGPLWQLESFDHIVRSETQLEHFRRYIEANPEKAGLHSGYVIGTGSELRKPKQS